MEAINPTVVKLQKLKIPRILSITFIYLIILTALFFAFAGIIPILVEQTTGLIKTLPDIIQHTNIYGLSAIDLSSQFKILEPLPGDIANIAVSIVSNLFSAIIILVVTFYLLLERNKLSKHSIDYFGENIGNKMTQIINELETRIGSWVNAQLLTMFSIGVLSYLVYLIIGLKYAVSLAIIAGILEIIPVIGSFIAVIFAAIIALTISPTVVLFVVIAWIILHQIANNFIIPKLMEKTCNLNPIVTILLLLIGNKLGGIPGAILAVPIYMTIEIILKVVFGKELKIK
jgi:predicted PurR-regulated permease PerM